MPTNDDMEVVITWWYEA